MIFLSTTSTRGLDRQVTREAAFRRHSGTLARPRSSTVAGASMASAMDAGSFDPKNRVVVALRDTPAPELAVRRAELQTAAEAAGLSPSDIALVLNARPELPRRKPECRTEPSTADSERVPVASALNELSTCSQPVTPRTRLQPRRSLITAARPGVGKRLTRDSRDAQQPRWKRWLGKN